MNYFCVAIIEILKILAKFWIYWQYWNNGKTAVYYVLFITQFKQKCNLCHFPANEKFNCSHNRMYVIFN